MPFPDISLYHCGLLRRQPYLLIILPLLLTACSELPEPTPAPRQKAPEIVVVDVITLDYHPWRLRINTYGHIVSAEKVALGVEIAGTVAGVHFREGQRITAGQQLLSLDDRKQQLRLERAEANVATAKAELHKARGTYLRLRTLLKRQVVARETYKVSQAAYRSANAKLNQVSAAEKLARQELQDLTLISPVDGTVESKRVERGQRVHPGDTLALIQATDSLQVITYVREQEVNLLRLGDSAPVRSPGVPGRTYEGRIESVGSTADARTGNFPVKLRIDNADGLLREGMSAEIGLHSRQAEERLLIPLQAITDRDRQRVVFVEREGRAVRVTPTLGMAMDGWVPVLAGLGAGERVIVNQLPLLADHNQVRANRVPDALPQPGEHPHNAITNNTVTHHTLSQARNP